MNVLVSARGDSETARGDGGSARASDGNDDGDGSRPPTTDEERGERG